MRRWYCIQEGRQHGPVPETDLVGLLETGELTPDTLVWTEELHDWAPARDIDGLIPPAYNPPPAPISQSVPTATLVSAYTPSGPQVRPWVRFWARLLDLYLFAFLAGLMMPIVYTKQSEIPDVVIGIIMLFVYVFIEGPMLAVWGTTPGKALLKVRVRNRDGSMLSYADGLRRAVRVWFSGLGMGIPIVTWATTIHAYKILTQHGSTSWDEEGNSIVSHQLVGPWRTMGAILLFTAFGFLSVLTSAEI